MIPSGKPATSSPTSSTGRSARRIRIGRCPAEASDSVVASASSTLRLSVMNFSSIPAEKSKWFSSLAAAAGEFSVRMQYRVSPENLAIIKAAATPLPETSPTAIAATVAGKRDEVVIVAADLVGRVVMGEELVAGDRRASTAAGTASAPARPA